MTLKQKAFWGQSLFLIAVFLVACDDSGSSTPNDSDSEPQADGGVDGGADSEVPEKCEFRESDLPTPTGPYCIGVVEHHFVDPDREEPFTPDDSEDTREVMVRVFYPAKPTSGDDFGVYLESATLESAVEELLMAVDAPGLKDRLAKVPVQFKPNAPPADSAGPFPLLLFSPGLGSNYQESTALLEELSSRGYVVAAVNHPYYSRVTEFPDGRSVTVSDPEEEDAWAMLYKHFSLLAGDLQLTLDELTALSNNDSDGPLHNLIDVENVGAFGHSIGGAAALGLIDADSRVKAGINMDGSVMYEGMGTGTVDVPILIHLAGTHTMLSDGSIAEYWTRAEGEKWALSVETAGHVSYTDWPALIAAFYSGESTGEEWQGTIDPTTMLRLVQESNRAFFDAHLKDMKLDIDALQEAYPEVEVKDSEYSVPQPTMSSQYLEMSDGTRIAADIWLPGGAAADHPVPTVVRATRYWRDIEVKDQSLIPSTASEDEARFWMSAGMAIMFVDVRGTGASFGTRTAPWSKKEVEDFGEIVDWIVDQEWSDGQVGAKGVSYSGNTADFFGLTEKSAVKIVAPLYTDFNVYTDGAYPGGIFNTGFVEAWSQSNQALDANDICAAEGIEDPAECEGLLAVVGGVRPVDGDEDHALLDSAVADHADNVDVFGECADTPFIDRLLSNTHYMDISPAAYTERLGPDAPVYVVQASWSDAATAHGALSRFMTTQNDTVLYIGPWSHGGGYDTDPFLDPDTPVTPSPSEQAMEMMSIFAYTFFENAPPDSREIQYYTFGDGTWRETTVWPPEDTVETAFHLRASGELTLEGAGASEDSVDYEVDFTATTGPQNRWWTQLGGPDVVYPDRSAEDEKLLTYTSSPMDEDLMLAGHPEIHLYLASTHEDGAVYVYLEDVAPDGTVTYLTEGQLRLIHRKTSDDPPPWHVFGPYHSFKEDDAAPMVPGEAEDISIMLQPVAALISTGHSLRIAIAGHDASNFARVPEIGDPTLTVFHDVAHPSRVILPVN